MIIFTLGHLWNIFSELMKDMGGGGGIVKRKLGCSIKILGCSCRGALVLGQKDSNPLSSLSFSLFVITKCKVFAIANINKLAEH